MVKRYTDEERPIPPAAPAQCYDCHIDYASPGWIEVVIPDDVWEIINPTYHKGAGLLCANCIAKRCVEAGLQGVPAMATAGPLVFFPTGDNTWLNSTECVDAYLRANGYDPEDMGNRLAEVARAQSQAQ